MSEALHNRDDGTPQEAKDLAASISSSRTALLVAHHEGRAAVCATAVLLCDPKYLGQVRSSVQQILPKVRHTTHCYVTAEEIRRVHTRHDVASTSPRATLARFETMERLLVPVVPFMLVPRSRPVIPFFSAYLTCHLRELTAGLALLFALVVGLNLTIAVGDGSDAALTWSATPIFIAQAAAMSLACLLFLAVCSRELMWALAKTFDFWYIVFQCMLMWISVATVVLSSSGGWCSTASVRLVSDAFYAMSIALAVGAFDASPFCRQTKGMISVCVGLFFAVSLTLMWTGESYSTKAWQATVTVGNWNYSAQTLYRMASLNVAIFCGKFAVTSLYLKYDAVILNCGRSIPLCDVALLSGSNRPADDDDATELTVSTFAA